MKKTSLLIFLFVTVLCGSAQTQKGMFVADRDVTATKKTPVHLTYGFQKGDKLLIYLFTNKKREIDRFYIMVDGKTVFEKKDFAPSEAPIEIIVPKTDFVHFFFEGPLLGRDITFKLERVPASEEGKFYNTALQSYKHYDYKTVDYEEDSVVGYLEPQYVPNKFTVVNEVVYESKQLDVQTHTIRAGKTKGMVFLKPDEVSNDPNKKLKFLGYQVIITTATTGEKVWKYISAGVDVGTLALSLAFPVVGTVGGLAVNTAFEMIGPQKNGEPVYYAILPNQTEVDNFTSNRSCLSYETGLATGYSAQWPPYDTLAIGVRNLNVTTDVKSTIAVFAIYQASISKEITQNTVVIRPKMARLKKQRVVIENVKEWGSQK